MGVRSTAILFGSWIRPLLVLCGLMFVTMLTVAGHLNGQGPAYFIVSVGGTLIHLLWQYMTVDLDMPKSCWSKSFFFKIPFIPCLIYWQGNFLRNGQLGWIVWGGLMIDYLLELQTHQSHWHAVRWCTYSLRMLPNSFVFSLFICRPFKLVHNSIL